MLGFHQEMAPDSAPDTIATSYMSIHEILLLFTGISLLLGKQKEILAALPLHQDGPLSKSELNTPNLLILFVVSLILLRPRLQHQHCWTRKNWQIL
jgi:hypothetical protein